MRAIGLSYSIFTSVDNKEIFVPNSHIANAKIINFNQLGRRRLEFTFSASYNASTQSVKEAIADAIARFPQIESSPAPEIHLSAYGDSCISYVARMWVSSADYWTVYYGMLEAVRETFELHGVQMSYNHLNVHMM